MAFVAAQLAFVAIHAVAARDVAAQAVDAQAVAHGTAADGVFPPVSPLAALELAPTNLALASAISAVAPLTGNFGTVAPDIDFRRRCRAAQEAQPRA